MRSVMADSRALMELFEHIVEVYPAFPDDETRLLRVELLREEYHEYLEAELNDDLVEVADGLADMMVIIAGTAHAYGIPFEEICREVHRTNMAKADPITGKLKRREDGKVLKPDGWIAPDLKSIIERAKK